MSNKISRYSIFSEAHSPVVKGYCLTILRLADALDEVIHDYFVKAKHQGIEGEALRAMKDLAEKHSEQLEVFFCKPNITEHDCLDLLQVMRNDHESMQLLMSDLDSLITRGLK